jgi:regulatory protein
MLKDLFNLEEEVEISDETLKLLTEKYLYEKAHNSALRLLSYRLRSKEELKDRLKRKNFPEPVIDEVLKNLEEKNLLDEDVLAQSLVRHFLYFRLKGKRKIIHELQKKRLSQETIRKVITELKEAQEKEVALKLLDKKRHLYRHLEPQERTKKLTELLLRSGFSLNIIKEVLKEA